MQVIGIRKSSELSHPYVGKEPAWSKPQWYGDTCMSCEVETADFLYSLVRLVKPRTILETGTHKGFSTVALAKGLYFNGKGLITTVDREDYNFVPYVLSKNHVEKHKIDETPTCEKVIQDALAYLEQAVKDGKKFDMIFCDDYHNAEHLEKELGFFDKLITHPGYLLFHDSYFKAMGDIGATIEKWAKERGYAHTRMFSATGLDMVFVGESK